MDFDPARAPVAPRPAASVLLLRAGAGGAAEVFLLRRHRGASFMARSFVFPGGAVDPGEEDDPRRAAARELFEEAGVLLADRPVDDAERARLRRAAAAEGTDFAALLAEAGLTLLLDRLEPFAHWVTPSAERKRFSARFYTALLPQGQTPSFDAVETVDELWVTPQEALARSAELRLPPPQLRMLTELTEPAAEGPEAVQAWARARAPHVRPIVPRLLLDEAAPQGFCLLCPWDRDYERGQGEGEPFPPGHPFGGGASRFVLDRDGAWRHPLDAG